MKPDDLFDHEDSTGTGDPRLTAYALGEMTPEEAQAFAAGIADNAAALAEVAEIRSFAEILRGEFARELAEADRPANVVPLPLPGTPAGRKVRLWAGLVAAAAAMLVAGVWLRQEWGRSTAGSTLIAENTHPADARRILSPTNELSDLAGGEISKDWGMPLGEVTEMSKLASPERSSAAPAVLSDPIGALDAFEKKTDSVADSGGSGVTATPEPLVVMTKPASADPVAIARPRGLALTSDGESVQSAQSNASAASLAQIPGKVKPEDRVLVAAEEMRGGKSLQTERFRYQMPSAGSAAPNPAELDEAVAPTPAAGPASSLSVNNAQSGYIGEVTMPLAHAHPASPNPVVDKAPSLREVPVVGSLFGKDMEGGEANGRPGFSARPSSLTPPSGRYAPTQDLPFQSALTQGVSTFSVDVDTASYTTMRRLILESGRLPERDAVRVEELINYFRYAYPAPDWQAVQNEGVQPFSLSVDSAAAPWQPAHRLVRVALKGAEVRGERPASNLVFLIDVSGSMQPADRLPLLQKCLREFAGQLTARDRVTLVVYAGSSGEVLAPTPGNDHARILTAIDALSAGGSTAGAAGLQLAYQRARETFIEGGVNRVLLATDGDFNVGLSSDESLVDLVEREAKSGISLTVLGVGQGNLNDSMLEKITNKGNGQYHYIDRPSEGHRILVEQMSGALVTIAKDVKIQVEFNPGRVAAFRLIGYANRVMPREHFEDDTKDAGDIGAGHTVTAFYEVVPVEAAGLTANDPRPQLEGRRYVQPVEPSEGLQAKSMAENLSRVGARLVESEEMMTVRLRYKQPEGSTSRLIESAFVDKGIPLEQSSADFRFAVAVASFGMRLRGTEFPGPAPRPEDLAQMVAAANAASPGLEPAERGRREEFLQILQRAAGLLPDPTGAPPAPGVGEDVRRKLEELR